MMHVCCVICKDFFLPKSEFCVTKCGHFYHVDCIEKWRDRSKSCPQCRTKLTSNPVRAYFGSEDSSDRADEIWSMKTKIDNLRESIANIKMEIDKKDSCIAKLNKELEDAVNTNNALKHQIQPLKEEVQNLTDSVENLIPLTDTNKYFMTRLENMRNLDTVIKGSESEFKRVLHKVQVSPMAVNTLCLFAAALKYELQKIKREYEEENKKNEVQYDKIFRRLQKAKQRRDTSETVIKADEPKLDLFDSRELTNIIDKDRQLEKDENSWSFPGTAKNKLVIVNLRDKTVQKKKDVSQDAAAAAAAADDDDDDIDIVIPTFNPNPNRLSRFGDVKENQTFRTGDGGCSGVSASINIDWLSKSSVLSTPFERRNLSKPSARKGTSKTKSNEGKSRTKNCADTKTLYSYFPRRTC